MEIFYTTKPRHTSAAPNGMAWLGFIRNRFCVMLLKKWEEL